jgi:hypothetical protein
MTRIGEKSQAEIAELFNVDRSTISRMMKEVRERELLKAGVDRGRVTDGLVLGFVVPRPLIRYRVVVGEIGSVYIGESMAEANLRFRSFVVQSKTAGSGLEGGSLRCSRFKDYEIVRESRPIVK